MSSYSRYPGPLTASWAPKSNSHTQFSKAFHLASPLITTHTRSLHPNQILCLYISSVFPASNLPLSWRSLPTLFFHHHSFWFWFNRACTMCRVFIYITSLATPLNFIHWREVTCQRPLSLDVSEVDMPSRLVLCHVPVLFLPHQGAFCSEPGKSSQKASWITQQPTHSSF